MARDSRCFGGHKNVKRAPFMKGTDGRPVRDSYPLHLRSSFCALADAFRKMLRAVKSTAILSMHPLTSACALEPGRIRQRVGNGRQSRSVEGRREDEPGL